MNTPLYIPGNIIEVPGRGLVDMDAYRVNRAINEYDERLFFDKDPKTNHWVIWIKMPHGKDSQPICGFTAVPSIEDAIGWLKKNDSKLHGADKLWNEHVKGVMAERKKISDEASDAHEEMAEYIEKYGRDNQKLRFWKSFEKSYESKVKK